MTLPDIEEIRAHNLNRNPSFNYRQRGLELLIDDLSQVSPAVLEHIRRLGFNLKGTKDIDVQKLMVYNTDAKHLAEHIFETEFGLITCPIDRDLLRAVSSAENPQLAKELESDESIKDILQRQFMGALYAEGNVSSYALGKYLMAHSSRKHHVLTLLTSLNLVAPILATSSSTETRRISLAYHPMGRKGKLYGGWSQMVGSKRAYVTVNLTPLRNQSPEIRDNFFVEIANHEIVGHVIMDLDDHNGVDPLSCLMATKKSDQECIEACKTRRDLYLCGECQERLPPVKNPLLSPAIKQQPLFPNT